MLRRLQPLWWFVLVPYFAVKSLNSRPFFTEDREFANRVNGLIALSLIFTFIVFGALNLTRWQYVLDSRIFDIGVYVVGYIAAAAAVTRDRERQHVPLYRAMQPAKRRAIGIAVFAIFTVAVIAALWGSGESAPALKGPSCSPGAEEITAACA